MAWKEKATAGPEEAMAGQEEAMAGQEETMGLTRTVVLLWWYPRKYLREQKQIEEGGGELWTLSLSALFVWV